MLVLFDYSNLVYRSFFAAQKDINDVGYQYLKHLIFQNIFYICYKFEATEVVIAVDDKKNWRKKIYKDYKANRQKNREEQDDIDWEAIYNAMDEHLREITTYFPFYVLKVDYMEADDIAGVIAKQYQDIEKTFVTSDSDYIQLLRFPNLQIWDPMKKIIVKEKNPEQFLLAKILSGDRGDYVPNILKNSMEDKIKKRMGETTAEKYAADKDLIKQLFNDETPIKDENGEDLLIESDGKFIIETFGHRAKQGYKRNKILIDLSCIPQQLFDKTIELYENYDLPDGKSIFKYFTQNKYRDFISRINEINEIIAKITKHQKQKSVF